MRRAPALAVLALLAAGAAVADDVRPRTPPPAVYAQECGACHVAYPARALGSAAWQRVIDGLPRHFGSDASLDAASTARIRDWLVAHAATKRADEVPPELRITRSTWFVREHREVPAAAWQRPAIRSAANCAACHTTADQGVFDEHAVRIPR